MQRRVEIKRRSDTHVTGQFGMTGKKTDGSGEARMQKLDRYRMRWIKKISESDREFPYSHWTSNV